MKTYNTVRNYEAKIEEKHLSRIEGQNQAQDISRANNKTG